MWETSLILGTVLDLDAERERIVSSKLQGYHRFRRHFLSSVHFPIQLLPILSSKPIALALIDMLDNPTMF